MTMRRAVLVLVVALAVIVPVAAIAATSAFEDVPDDSVYVNDINWLAASGVTKGCNPPANTRFCPGSNVTREQMAAFMHRLSVNQVVDAGRLQGYTANQLMGGSGSTATGGGQHFAWGTDPITVSHNVWTEIGEFQVTFPANGGVANVSSLIALEPAGDLPGAFATVLQTYDTPCDGSAASAVGYADMANAYYGMPTLVAAFEAEGGTHTIRNCIITEQIVTSEKTLVNQSQIAVVWTPRSLGGHSLDAAGPSPQDIKAAIDGMDARADAVRDLIEVNGTD